MLAMALNQDIHLYSVIWPADTLLICIIQYTYLLFQDFGLKCPPNEFNAKCNRLTLDNASSTSPEMTSKRMMTCINMWISPLKSATLK